MSSIQFTQKRTERPDRFKFVLPHKIRNYKLNRNVQIHVRIRFVSSLQHFRKLITAHKCRDSLQRLRN